ncbi:RloB family protein [uncultured Rothia sp.]|uniref:RloB family protein n=2 Tax=uncultured Rothia sp. TaxID=316088 RepID=UPI0028D30951|nr:RloB family protein [uncultured Rothia sp.]
MSGRRSLRRDPRKPRAMKKRILICVEGENTEIRYFQSLIQELRSEKTHVFVDKPKGTDPMSILTGCLNNTGEYSERFCVIDVDQHQNLEKALSDAAKNGISIVVTNIKFEVWLLWHIDDFPNSYMSSSDINKRVKNICKKFPFMTGRNNKDLHSSFPIGNYHEASIRARRRDPNMAFNKKGPNPSSAMPLLIDKIKNG